MLQGPIDGQEHGKDGNDKPNIGSSISQLKTTLRLGIQFSAAFQCSLLWDTR
jgi:hypothetical protein